MLIQNWRQRRAKQRAIQRMPPRPIQVRSDEIVAGVPGLIGNTPLVRIGSLSNALGVEILGKCEFLNPGGSVKDRVALKMIEDAEARGLLRPHTGSVLFEGTVGSTGISLATVGKAKGYGAHICMPSDVASDKVDVLERLGAEVERVPPVSIVDQNQFVNLAKRRAHEFGGTDLDTHGTPGVLVSSQATGEDVHGPDSRLHRHNVDSKPRGFFADQFENESNFQAHYKGTGPEIARQTGGHGIGINRITRNFMAGEGIVDDAFRVTDEEAVAMSRYLVEHDGLFLGSSSACNLVAAVRLAKTMPKGSRIVTILCDSGARHQTKFWSDQYLKDHDIKIDPTIIDRLLAEKPRRRSSAGKKTITLNH
ncbi:hypothetical protein A1Q2_01738 [Trichosporon asahii var. asahii CBS 8904]|uniref:Tryptophan synthase beta chain-like PALP domain-containing protein n=1 Tax=Trichosporon asahii var. asahii (strain CBS 8904) TaxID=1220162 RepID=K1W4Y8_TRIAC|nr:hypothetical protein A1Q2_01738 [Trichosporon asahii var. asahii CBS 8904]